MLQVEYRLNAPRRREANEGLIFTHTFEGWVPGRGDHVKFQGLQGLPIAPEGAVQWHPAFVVVDVIWEPQIARVAVWCREV
jgi:hypothetical protein